MLKKSIQGSQYVVLPEKPTDEELNKLKTQLRNKVDRLDLESKRPLSGSTATVTLLTKNLQCPLRTHYVPQKINPVSDYCDANAFVELNYKIDMAGSKFTSKENSPTGSRIKTEDGKYLIITLSPQEEGGPGWHLADDIKQDHSWFQSWGNRRDFVGPFASKYNLWVKNNTVNPSVSLVETFPQNTNPESTIIESHGVTIGLSGGLKGGSSNSIDLTSFIQISDRRDVSYKTFEYTVENNSYNNTATWIWNAKIKENICNYLTRRDFNYCYFTGPVWDGSWTTNTAISHKSFTPSLQAIYKATNDTTKLSIFEVGTNVEIGAILGGIFPFGTFSYFETKLVTYNTPDIVHTFTIDWSSPYFASEQNIRLQNMTHIQNTKCLVVTNGNKVTQENCRESRSQIWGYDSAEKQFKSRVINNHCLVVNQDNFLEVKSCSVENNQKWILNSDGFMKLHADPSKAIGAESNGDIKMIEANSPNAIKFEPYKSNL
jgi:Leukocidin/Hemolysin toxin family/Ricin-type beta-trefoil lectin domain